MLEAIATNMYCAKLRYQIISDLSEVDLVSPYFKSKCIRIHAKTTTVGYIGFRDERK
jgi:hypothetical protein